MRSTCQKSISPPSRARARGATRELPRTGDRAIDTEALSCQELVELVTEYLKARDGATCARSRVISRAVTAANISSSPDDDPPAGRSPNDLT